MKCFGKPRAHCRQCGWANACYALQAFDKSVYRSNRRYGLLKMDVDTARERGLRKRAPIRLPETEQDAAFAAT